MSDSWKMYLRGRAEVPFFGELFLGLFIHFITNLHQACTYYPQELQSKLDFATGRRSRSDLVDSGN